MMDFISHNVILSLGVIFLVLMFLTGKISGVIVKGIALVILAMVVLSIFMGLYQKGTTAVKSITPGGAVMWVVGELGNVGGKIIGTLFGAGENMQTGYRSCLFDAFEHEPANKNGNAMFVALKSRCPNLTAVNQDAQFESCLSSVLGEYDPTAITTCQSKYQSPAGLTKSTVIQSKVCSWFPSLCSAAK
jgi:hypothetical protein